MEEEGRQTLKSFLLRCKTGLWRKRICFVDKLPSLHKERELPVTTVHLLRCDTRSVRATILTETPFLHAAVCKVTGYETTAVRWRCYCLQALTDFKSSLMLSTWSRFVRSRTICPAYLSHTVSFNPKNNETGNILGERIMALKPMKTSSRWV